MEEMFYNCQSLIFLNLKSFTDESLIDIDKMFYGIMNKLNYCISTTKAPNIILAIKKDAFSHKENL